MKQLDLRRHAQREPDDDRLSPEGIARAEDVGRTLPLDYAIIFISPKRRAAETVAWFLRGSGQQLGEHAVVDGLAGSYEEIPDVVIQLFDDIPEGGRGLAVGHTPLIEEAVVSITGTGIEPLAECEGVRLTLGDDGSWQVEEFRVDPV